MGFMDSRQAYDLQDIFKSVYGDEGFGIPKRLQELYFKQGMDTLSPQFAALTKNSLAGANARGYSGPASYSNVMSNVNSAFGRAMASLQNSIMTQSMQAGEQQKELEFSALSNLQAIAFEAWLKKKMGKPGFMDLLGKLLGQAGEVGAFILGKKL